jgi:uroporphyrinogen decarboxylase
MTPDSPGYWEIYVEFWLGLGYDCIPMEVPLNCPLPRRESEAESVGSEAAVVVRSEADFANYPWPATDSPIDFRHFDLVAGLLPDGVKIVAGVAMGPYEWVSRMMGVEGLSLALQDGPDLVGAMFSRIGELIVAADTRIAQMASVGALRQGDDLGFKTATFLRPEDLRAYVFPWYASMAEIAHAQGKPFILHSCGDLELVYEDLIEGCRIDAKHSFEDTILPVQDFKARYGERITPLGGLDVDRICRSTEAELRAYTRKLVDACFADGWWALGTGNSLTDYMPVQNYAVVLEEGRRYTSG